MIDLSHLTEEEQGMILTVLRRDADLKKAEEERVRKLERVLTSESESENKLKYLSGEWFYEAKSRRHMDKIHGSEIILASIKHKREGSVRSDRSRTSSSRGSDIVAPPKPARCLELLQLHDNNDCEKDNVNEEVSPPRTPRRNPFNRASLVVMETPENDDQNPEFTETEVKPHNVSTLTSQASVPSENSALVPSEIPSLVPSETSSPVPSETPSLVPSMSLGFKPVPKKRTFVSRRRCSQSDDLGLQGADFPARPSHLVPAPRRSVLRGSGPDQGPVLGLTGAVSSAEENSHQALGLVSQRAETSSVQSDRGRHSSSVATTERHEDPSLTQSIVDPDPPVSYDLNYIEKSNQQTQKKTNKKNVFTLSTQASSPTGDRDSIDKVLDWFSRSLDSLDFVGTEEEPQRSTKTSERHEDTSRDVLDKDSMDTQRQASDSTGRTQEVGHEDDQTSKISHLKTFWETKNTGPKILTHTSNNEGQKVSSEKDEVKGQSASDKDMEDNVCVNNKQQVDSERDRRRSDLQSRESPDKMSQHSTVPESLDSERPHMVHNDVHGSAELDKDVDAEKKNLSPKPKDDGVSNKDRGDTAERIKQLRSFWEQERNKPIFYSPPSPSPDLQNLNQRFTKSQYDLSSVGHQDADEEDRNQGLEKMSPTLSASRSQFNSLRDFWDEAASETKSSKPKSPQRKEVRSFQEMNDSYRLSVLDMKTSASPQSRTKSGSGSRPETNDSTTAESKRSSKDSEKVPKAQTRPPKSRKDSFSRSSGSSLRRSTSMFSLSAAQEPDPDQFLMDLSPAHFQSRKQRQNAVKGTKARRSSEGPDTLAPRARAFLPSDYRHYLGMTEKDGGRASLAPALADDDDAFDANAAPIRASTPLTSEERHRKANKTNQHPLWPNYSGSDTGQESSVSSASETWSTSRNSASETWSTSRNSFNPAGEKDDDGQNPVKKALRRAEAWPKTQTKSIEDIAAASRDRNKESSEQRRASDASSLLSPSSSLDSEHLKKMSKSVPSFLQQEDEDGDAAVSPDYEDIFLRRSSMTNLASLSSLSGSIMTMYSGDFGNVDVQGNIHFSINYVHKLQEFHIFVSECQDLAAVDPKRGRSEPYVKSYLLPDKANLGKRKTSVKKKTLNPKFNEILRYGVSLDYLRTQTLFLSVWHHDTFGRNSFLGEVDVDLSTWDFDHAHMNSLDLRARTTPTLAPPNGRGEMKLAIRFLPQISHSEGVAKDGPNTGEVHIWVKECRNLPLIRAAIDPYVKCFVLPDTSRKSRQKTRVLRRTVDPAFNHTMVYDGISDSDLPEACVELTVWDRDRLASHLLGGVRLGVGTGKSYGAPVSWMDSTAHEVALWERMMASPDEWVESVLPLRTVHSAKTAFK